MAENSKIEWTDHTWTPIRARNLKTGKVGWYCEHATTGCEFCYAEGMNKRLGTGLPFKPGHRKDVELFLDEKMLLAPLRWRKPRMIFVCSMTDLFADFVTDEWIDKIFHTMGACDDLGTRHTFQILTKRAERMRDYMLSGNARRAWNAPRLAPNAWPPRNVWLGASTERQQEADERIPLLLQTPAAVRFVSAEPLIGPIDFTAIEAPDKVEGERWTFNALETGDYYEQWSETLMGEPRRSGGDGPHREHKLDWVIVGGESGPGARPMHPDWARSIREQCASAGVAYFFKQWGEHQPAELMSDGRPEPWRRTPDGRECWELDELQSIAEPAKVKFYRVGKKRAGRLLDGVEHNAMPMFVEVAA